MMKIILLLGANWVVMAGASLTPAVPEMMEDFSSVVRADVWVPMILTLPAFFLALGGPLAGYLTDKIGRKYVLTVSLLLAGLSGSAGFFIHQLGMLLLTRGLLGLSIAGATTATNALIADYFKDDERAKFMGLYTAFTGLGGVLFLPIGGLLADLNWRFAFFTYLPALIISILGLFFIFEPKEITLSKDSFKSSRLTLNATMVYIFLAVFLFQFSFLTLPVYSAQFFHSIVIISSVQVGLVGALSAFFSFFGGLSYDQIRKRASFRGTNIISILFCGLGFFLLSLAESWFLLILSQIIIGFWGAVVLANLSTWLANQASFHVRGRANGIFVTMMFIGHILTSLIFSPIIRFSSYGFAYFISAIIISLIGVSGFLIAKPSPVGENPKGISEKG